MLSTVIRMVVLQLYCSITVRLGVQKSVVLDYEGRKECADENWCIRALCEGRKEGECGWNLVYYSPSTLLSLISTHEFVPKTSFY